MKSKRVAIYCRVDGGGDPEMQRQVLHLQKEKLKRYAHARGLQIFGYYQDVGYSGHNLNRPGLAQLIHDCGDGAFEQVLVINRSRLYRGSRRDEPKWPFRICSMNQLEQDLIR